MACDTKVYKPRNVEGYGTLGNYSVPAVFIDGMLQPAPKGWKLPNCYLNNSGNNGNAITPSNNVPFPDRLQIDGGGAAGSATNYALEDHIHPLVAREPYRVDDLTNLLLAPPVEVNIVEFRLAPTTYPVVTDEQSQTIHARMIFQVTSTLPNAPAQIRFAPQVGPLRLRSIILHGVHDPGAPANLRRTHPALMQDVYTFIMHNPRAFNFDFTAYFTFNYVFEV